MPVRIISEIDLQARGWKPATEENFAALNYQRAVKDLPPIESRPPLQPGELALVWAGNNRKTPSYIGRILSVWFNYQDRLRAHVSYYTFRYTVERPDGSIEEGVDGDHVSQRAARARLQDEIGYSQLRIEELTRRIKKFQEGLAWIDRDELGWFSRDYQHKPPKKAKGKGK